ncbi:MAG TPA: DUF2207 domain-containing protein [Gemmatimonadales bacterium]|jgi:uncharacterized membrane protein
MSRCHPIWLLAALWMGGAPAVAQERSLAIERFHATIQVEPSGTIQVAESIVARFTGSWNGIYRTIPVKYRTAQGLNWTLGLDLQSATDEAGRPLRVEASRERHYIKYKIWVPDALDATRTVVLRYRATNGLRFFEEHDELYWNVTGDEWDVPIEAASARIELPPGTEGIRAIAFNGVYGSTAQEAAVETQGTTVRIAMPHALAFSEGLTAVVGWNKGMVVEPSTTDRAMGVVGSNWPLAIPIPVFFLVLAIWRRRGKDPRRLPVTVRYEPPAGLTPGEAGTLLDNAADQRDVTATLVDLGVRGYLRFEERDDKMLFGLISKREYVLHRLDPPSGVVGLAPHEQQVMDGVFKDRGNSVELSDLQDEFYTELPKIRKSLFDRLLGHGFYHARPDQVRTHWMVGGVVLGFLLGGIGSAAANRFLMTPVPFIVAAVLVALIVIAFGTVMPARTEAGARALEQVLGFEEFLRRVEAEHLKKVIIGHPELFDRYLPFAMAFGVEKKWAKAFEGIYRDPPTWYVGSNVSTFSVGHLSSSLGDFSSKVGSTMASSPRSSSGSGFGGGGSSGGGGGGGGGGGF